MKNKNNINDLLDLLLLAITLFGINAFAGEFTAASPQRDYSVKEVQHKIELNIQAIRIKEWVRTGQINKE